MRTPRNDRLTSTGMSPSRLREGLGVGLANAPPSPDVPTPGPSRKREGSKPERRCVLTRDIRGRAELTRLAVSPDGLVLPDVNERAPGRGAWIGVGRSPLENALVDGTLKRALARAFGTGALDIPNDLPERVERALERLLLDRLGLELRAGNVLMGSQRIDKAAREGRVVALFHAADASADGAAKLDQAWRVGSDREGTGEGGARLPLDRAALSVAMGRDNVVHLAAIDEGASRRIAAVAVRLAQYREAGLPKAADGGGHDHAEQSGAAEATSAEQEMLKD